MQLGKIKQLYDAVNSINPTLKTLIILALVGIIAGSTIKYHAKSILEDYTQQVATEKRQQKNIHRLFRQWLMSTCRKFS